MPSIPDNPLEQIQSISPPLEKIDSDAAQKEDCAYELKQENLRRSRLYNDQFEADIRERRKYATRIFVLVVCWLIAVLLILLLQCVEKIEIWDCVICFGLSDAVLLALIGSTTANVLFTFHFVLKYLYPKLN